MAKMNFVKISRTLESAIRSVAQDAIEKIIDETTNEAKRRIQEELIRAAAKVSINFERQMQKSMEDIEIYINVFEEGK